MAPIRIASHLAVLMVLTIAILISQIEELPELPLLLNLPANGLFAEDTTGDIHQSTGNLPSSRHSMTEGGEAIQRAAIPSTVQNDEEPAPVSLNVQNVELSTSTASFSSGKIQKVYTVRQGDTVTKIADQNGLKPDTILWANPLLEPNPDMLKVGDRLVILPVDGALHIVRQGDTLSSIAAKYKVSIDEIVDYSPNNLKSGDTRITIGTQLVIPNGTKPYVPLQVVVYQGEIPASASKGSGTFAWPVSGIITQRFWNGHTAIDIGAWTGASIVAADSGYVVAARSGWNNGYGTMVMIDHGNGRVSLYAHMHSIYVRQGENVAKGTRLGTVGNTGSSTGPHLHFEIREWGVARNPFNYLPRK